jgi:hypothetical protein
MTNFYKDEPEKFKPCFYPCIYFYGDPDEDNQEETNEELKFKIQNLFL